VARGLSSQKDIILCKNPDCNQIIERPAARYRQQGRPQIYCTPECRPSPHKKKDQLNAYEDTLQGLPRLSRSELGLDPSVPKQAIRDRFAYLVSVMALSWYDRGYTDFSILTLPNEFGIRNRRSVEWQIHNLRQEGLNPHIYGIELDAKRREKMQQYLEGGSKNLKPSITLLSGKWSKIVAGERLKEIPNLIGLWPDYMGAFGRPYEIDAHYAFRDQNIRGNGQFVYAVTFATNNGRGLSEGGPLVGPQVEECLGRVARKYGYELDPRQSSLYPYLSGALNMCTHIGLYNRT